MSNFDATANIVFLHPPKTGGTSLHAFLCPWRRGGFSPAKPAEVRTQVGDDVWNTARKVITVREPFQRCVSAYKFFGWANKMPFSDWLETGVFSYGEKWHDPCVRWLPGGDVLIYKCEELSTKFPGIQMRVQSEGPSWQELWSQRLQKIVSQRYAEDYERFNYATPKP